MKCTFIHALFQELKLFLWHSNTRSANGMSWIFTSQIKTQLLVTYYGTIIRVFVQFISLLLTELLYITFSSWGVLVCFKIRRFTITETARRCVR